MVTCWGGLDTKGTGFGEKRWGWSSDPTCPPSQEVSMGSKQMRKVPVAFPTSHWRGKLKRSYEKREGLLLDLGFWDSPSNNPRELELIMIPRFYFAVSCFPSNTQCLSTPSTLPLAPLPNTAKSYKFNVFHACLQLGEGKGWCKLNT